MNNETVLTDTSTNTDIKEKQPTENVSPIVEMSDKNLQPKTGSCY